MKIVGFHGGHDSAYAILENGVPIVHNELERFNRQKWSTSFPILSSTWCLDSNKLKDICQFCKEKMGDEVHHLSPQKDANENDYVESHHKNHSGNLISVCEKCHDIIHSHELMGKFKKTTKGYKLEFKKIEA